MVIETEVEINAVNPLRTVNAYIRQGNKYLTLCKQITITSPPFTL